MPAHLHFYTHRVILYWTFLRDQGSYMRRVGVNTAKETQDIL